MASPLRVLFIEDSEEDKLLLIRELERGGYQVNSERVDTESALRAALRKQSWDLVITDYNMPHFSAPGVLGVLKESGIDLPCIIVTGSQGEETAVATMKAGAHDFILKGNLSRLVPAVAREIKEAELRQEQKRTERAVQHLAYYDTLTDLPNRTLLQDRLQQAILAAGGEAQRDFGMDMDARRQAITEIMAQRQTPLNEIGAFRSGSQIAPLSFQPYTGTTVQPAPHFQGVVAQGQANQNAYNAQQANQNAMMSGLFQLGAAGMGLF